MKKTALVTGASRGIGRAIALQLAKDGITVNDVAPGVICTDHNAQALADPEYAQSVMDSIPCGLLRRTQGLRRTGGLSLL